MFAVMFPVMSAELPEPRPEPAGQTRRHSMSHATAEPSGPGPGAATAGLSADPEAAIVERAGYKPELRRSLRFFSMFAIAFSIISITTGIFLNYAWGLQHWGRRRSGPGPSWAWAT